MANYTLVANSKFRPFSYQELAAPLDRQDAYHEKLMDEYDKLSSQADVLEAMGANDRDKNSKVYQQYKNYSDRLRAEADNLYRNGLNAESRMRLSELRRSYNTDIVPIQHAWQKREAEADMQLKAQMQDPTIMFSRNASSTSLQDYIDNPTGGFKTISGKLIAAQVGTAAQALAKQIIDNPNGKVALELKNVDPFTYQAILRKGLSAEEVRDWQNHPALKNIVDNVLLANGITRDQLGASYDSIYNQSMGYAGMGAYQAIGDQSSQFLDNWQARQDYTNALAIKLKQAEAAAAAGLGGDESYFDVSEYELPMMGVDGSHAKEQKNAMKTLGYTLKEDSITGEETLSSTGKVTVDGKEVSIFGKDGKIMTRRQFLSQAYNTEKSKRKFGEYFDKMVEASKTLGLYGNLYTQNELSRQYNKLRDASAANFARVYALNYENSDWNTTSKNYPVREIKDYRGGQPVFDSKQLSLNDVLNAQDSNKKNINVSAFWSNVQGHQGIILTTRADGKNRRFFIDASTIPEDHIREALKRFDDAEKYKALNTEEGNRNARKAISTALGLLHTGLTVHNKPYDQSIVRQPTLKQEGLAD